MESYKLLELVLDKLVLDRNDTSVNSSKCHFHACQSELGLQFHFFNNFHFFFFWKVKTHPQWRMEIDGWWLSPPSWEAWEEIKGPCLCFVIFLSFLSGGSSCGCRAFVSTSKTHFSPENDLLTLNTAPCKRKAFSKSVDSIQQQTTSPSYQFPSPCNSGWENLWEEKLEKKILNLAWSFFKGLTNHFPGWMPDRTFSRWWFVGSSVSWKVLDLHCESDTNPGHGGFEIRLWHNMRHTDAKLDRQKSCAGETSSWIFFSFWHHGCSKNGHFCLMLIHPKEHGGSGYRQSVTAKAQPTLERALVVCGMVVLVW